MSSDWQPILAIDFDGVIHDYMNGWQGGEIYGSFTPGFAHWASKAKKEFTLCVYSTRSADMDGINAMREWMIRQIKLAKVEDFYLDLKIDDFQFAHRKPPAFLQIDDRALTFNGDWADFDPAKLKAFQPWNKKA